MSQYNQDQRGYQSQANMNQQYANHPQSGYGGQNSNMNHQQQHYQMQHHPQQQQHQQQQSPGGNHNTAPSPNRKPQPTPQAPVWKPNAYETKQLDAWFYHIDEERVGVIKGAQAVTFLKKSNLHREILRKIWALVDTQNRGFIDKNQFFVTMRLVSICHNIKDLQDLSMETYSRTVYADFPFPPMVENEAPAPGTGGSLPEIQVAPASPVAKPKSSPQQPIQHKQHQQQQPIQHQQHQQQHSPPQLYQQPSPQHHPQSFHQPSPNVMSPQGHPYPQMTSPVGGHGSPLALPPPQAYAMTAEEFGKYISLFKTYDKDGDGYLTGADAFPIFMKSGVDRQILRSIWAFSDRDNDSRIDGPEFAVAFHLILCVGKKHLPAPPCLPGPLLAVLAQHSPGPQHQSQHQHQHPPQQQQHPPHHQQHLQHQQSGHSMTASSHSQNDFDDDFDDFQGSAGDVNVSSNMSCGSLNDMSSVGNMSCGGGGGGGMFASDDLDFDDFQDAISTSTPTNTTSNSGTFPTTHLPHDHHHNDDGMFDFQQAPPVEIALTNNALLPPAPPSPKRVTKSIADLLSSVSNDPLNLKASKTTTDSDHLADEEEAADKQSKAKAKAMSVVKTPPAAPVVPNSPPPSVSLGMSAFDELAEMDLQASLEDWDEFADESTAPHASENQVKGNENDDEFGDFGESNASGMSSSDDKALHNTTEESAEVGAAVGTFTINTVHTTESAPSTTGVDAFSDAFGEMTNENHMAETSDDFGDFSAGENHDDFGDFSAGDTKTFVESHDDFGDFPIETHSTEKHADLGGINSGGKNTAVENHDEFGDFPTETISNENHHDDFGDFSAGSSNTIGEKEDDFGDFPTETTISAATSSVEKHDDFGDFSASATAHSAVDNQDDFGDFSTETSTTFVANEEEDFGDFDAGDFSSSSSSTVITNTHPSASASFATATATATASVTVQNQLEDEFGDFSADTAPVVGSPSTTTAPSQQSSLEFSLEGMDDPFADIGERLATPAMEFSLLDMDMPISPSSAVPETFDLNSLLFSQSTSAPPPAPGISSLLAASKTTPANTDDSLLLLDFPPVPAASNYSTLPNPVNRNLNFDELEHLASVLSELNCFVEAYGALCQAQSVKRIRELSVKKMEAVENDDLELAIQLRDAINQEREEGVTATRLDEKAWLDTAATGVDKLKTKGNSVSETASIEKLVAAVGKLDANCGKQAKMKFLALRPSPHDVDKQEFLRFNVNAQRSLQLAIAVRSTHKHHVKHWQVVLNRTTVVLTDGINSLEQFKQMPAAMQQTVMAEASADGGKFNTFVRGILQVAEVGSWIAVSCLEAMVETASATKTLSLCEVVVRLASTLRKMPHVVMPVVSLEELATRSDRQLSRQGVTYCNITLRPIIVASSMATSKKGSSGTSSSGAGSTSSCSGASVVIKNVPYLQGAVSLWVHHMKGEAPPSHRVSPFV